MFVPTVDSSVEWRDFAISVAIPSIQAARTGVARTWRVPEPTWAAVCSGFTVKFFFIRLCVRLYRICGGGRRKGEMGEG